MILTLTFDGRSARYVFENLGLSIEKSKQHTAMRTDTIAASLRAFDIRRIWPCLVALAEE